MDRLAAPMMSLDDVPCLCTSRNNKKGGWPALCAPRRAHRMPVQTAAAVQVVSQ